MITYVLDNEELEIWYEYKDCQILYDSKGYPEFIYQFEQRLVYEKV